MSTTTVKSKKAALPVLKACLIDPKARVPEEDRQGCLLLQTTTNIILRPFGHAELTTGLRFEVPEGYRLEARTADYLQVNQLITSLEGEAVLHVYNRTPHFRDISPGDVVALVYLVKLEEFKLEVQEG